MVLNLTPTKNLTMLPHNVTIMASVAINGALLGLEGKNTYNNACREADPGFT